MIVATTFVRAVNRIAEKVTIFSKLYPFGSRFMSPARTPPLMHIHALSFFCSFHGIGYSYGIYVWSRLKKLVPVGYLCSSGDYLDQKMCIYGAVWWDGPFRHNTTLAAFMCQGVHDAGLKSLCLDHKKMVEIDEDLFYFTAEMEEPTRIATPPRSLPG